MMENKAQLIMEKSMALILLALHSAIVDDVKYYVSIRQKLVRKVKDKKRLTSEERNLVKRMRKLIEIGGSLNDYP